MPSSQASPSAKSNKSRATTAPGSEKKQLIGTFPYPVVKGLPTYETDYQNLGQRPMTSDRIIDVEREAERRKQADADATMGSRPASRKIRTANAASTGALLRLKKTADGVVVPRPPLSRSTSYDSLGEIQFVGPNFKVPDPLRMANVKKGLRLSKCWDNCGSYGSDSWKTTNADFGSILKPSVLKQKRAGLISFELLRFLPNHPHWKDRPYKPGQYIKCPKSTYSDLGSYYVDGYKLPPEYQYTLTQRKKFKVDDSGLMM